MLLMFERCPASQLLKVLMLVLVTHACLQLLQQRAQAR
jgi:hypothetical protein